MVLGVARKKNRKGKKKNHKFFGWGTKRISTPINPTTILSASPPSPSLFSRILLQSSSTSDNNSPSLPCHIYFNMAEEVYDGAIGIDLGAYYYPMFLAQRCGSCHDAERLVAVRGFVIVQPRNAMKIFYSVLSRLLTEFGFFC